MKPIPLLKTALIVFLTTLTLFAVPARAQESEAFDQYFPEQREPPYENQFLRLSEILGAIQYLRMLCDSDEGGLWRDEMSRLLEAEAPTAIRRARLIDRFNRGFDSFRSVYRTCTPAAIVAIDRYMKEGANIARDISARYGK